MGSVAASGGYYVAARASDIFALPLTVTGSIGIFYGKADVSGLLDKIGVTIDTYKTAPRADAESLFRGVHRRRASASSSTRCSSSTTCSSIACRRGRHMTKAEVDAVGQGRVWTGQQAIERKLVDKLGGLREALAEAESLAGLASDAPIAEYPIVERSLLDQALGLGIESHALSLDSLPLQLRDAARAIAPMAAFTSDVPLARMEWVTLDESTKTTE